MMTSPRPEPGWYLDPGGTNTRRFWDGKSWTEHRRPISDGTAHGRRADSGGSFKSFWLGLSDSARGWTILAHTACGYMANDVGADPVLDASRNVQRDEPNFSISQAALIAGIAAAAYCPSYIRQSG
jgi:hypothetical protein